MCQILLLRVKRRDHAYETDSRKSSTQCQSQMQQSDGDLVDIPVVARSTIVVRGHRDRLADDILRVVRIAASWTRRCVGGRYGRGDAVVQDRVVGVGPPDDYRRLSVAHVDLEHDRPPTWTVDRQLDRCADRPQPISDGHVC